MHEIQTSQDLRRNLGNVGLQQSFSVPNDSFEISLVKVLHYQVNPILGAEPAMEIYKISKFLMLENCQLGRLSQSNAIHYVWSSFASGVCFIREESR